MERGKVTSDRSGQVFYRRDCVIEPGTKILVHRSESDGKWNIKDHPQNFIKGKTDKFKIRDARPDINFGLSNAILHTDEGSPLLMENGLPIAP